jgi:hypothetical protein
MDLLGDYSEESDEENSPKETKVIETLVKKNQMIEPTATPAGKKTKKKKKLDISFLPENIQAALTRGDTAGDSDSDQEETSVISHTPVSHEAFPAHELLSKLPKPKASSNMTELGNPKKKPEIFVSKSETENKPVESVYSPISLPQSVHVESASDSDSDTDDVAVVSSVPSIPTSGFVPQVVEVSPSPSTSSSVFTEPPITLPSFEYSAPTHNPQYSSVFNPYHPSISATAPSTSNATISSLPQQKKSSKTNSFRKRDREIESSLLRGDTSLLDPMTGSDDLKGGAQIIDVQHNHEWNADYYYNQQKRQKELQTIFNFKQNGGDKMLSQPTKLQNKRHQINSLVMSAAESEFELLEAKGRQMKTKYETQSKYGW